LKFQITGKLKIYIVQENLIPVLVLRLLVVRNIVYNLKVRLSLIAL